MEAEIAAVSKDPSAQSLRLSKTKGLEFPLLSDPGLNAIDAFGLRHPGAAMDGGDIARPAVFILDREGRVVWRHITDNWRVRVRPETILDQLRKIP